MIQFICTFRFFFLNIASLRPWEFWRRKYNKLLNSTGAGCIQPSRRHHPIQLCCHLALKGLQPFGNSWMSPADGKAPYLTQELLYLWHIREIYNPSGLPFPPWHMLTLLNWALWAPWNMGRLQVTQWCFIPYTPILLCSCIMGNLMYLLQLCIYFVYTHRDHIICNIYRLFLGTYWKTVGVTNWSNLSLI